jgi:hypothetical protein
MSISVIFVGIGVCLVTRPRAVALAHKTSKQHVETIRHDKDTARCVKQPALGRLVSIITTRVLESNVFYESMKVSRGTAQRGKGECDARVDG